MKFAFKNASPALIASLYLIGSLAFVAFEGERVSHRNQERVQQELATAAGNLTAHIKRHIELYQYGLRGARGVVVASSRDLSIEEFRRYSASRDIDSEFPGARGFGFIRRVPVESEPEFLQYTRHHGYPDFAIKQLSPHDGERFVIEYIEPVERNRQAVGLDIASERNRRTAAIDAMRSGEVRLTAPITLVQALGKVHQSFLILMPVYPGGATPGTAAERMAKGIGWSYAPLVMEEVLADFDWNRGAIFLQVRDVTDPENRIEVYASSADFDHATVPGIVFQETVFGRQWELRYSASPVFIQSLGMWGVGTTYLVGGLISLLAAAGLWAFLNSRSFKRQAEEHRDRVSALIESSPDAIIFCDLESAIEVWNQSAVDMFGFSPVEAIGANLSTLIVPESLLEEERDILQRITDGDYVPHFKTRRRTKKGHELEVSIAVAPMVVDGEVVGYSKTIRDVTDEMMAQRQVVEMNRNLESLVNERTAEVVSSRKTLKGILDNMPSRVTYWDKDLNLVMANKGALEQLKISTEAAFGQPMSALMDERAIARTKPLLQQVATSQKLVSDELSVVAAGKPHHLLIVIAPELDGDQLKGYYSISTDVTEIRQNQLQLEAVMRENQALLETINEQMLYSVTDAQGRIIDANANFCKACGYEREELIGRDHRILNAGYHPEGFWADMWSAVSSDRPWRGEICNRVRDGSLRWFDSVIAPFKGANGEIERYVALRTDITEKRRVEEERNQVNTLLSNVLNAASEVSFIAADCDGVITIFNSGAEAMLGYRAEEMIGRQTPAIIHREDEVIHRGLELTEQYGEEIAGFEVFVYLARRNGFDKHKWTYVRKDGSELSVSLVVTAMRDEAGEVIGYLGVAIDISAEEQSRLSLMSARDQLEIAAEVADLGVWSFDPRTRLVEWNSRMYEIYQWPEPMPVTLDQWLESIHPDDLETSSSLINQIVQYGSEENHVDYRIVTPGGEVRSIQAGAQAERDASGQVIKVTGINRDVTQQLNFERDLRQAKELADSSNAAKSAFLANMSHEIRTPMNAVLGMLKLVGNTSMTERQQDYIQKADIAAKALLGLLNDLLDFSKIEAGKLTLEEAEFDLDKLMRDLGIVLSGYQARKSVELVYDIDPRLPQRLVGDVLRWKQVLINLGGNALKFTETGHVIIRLRMTQQQGNKTTLRVEVEDSGIGISEEHQHRIFDDFTQAESSTSRRFGGTGLGLVICKRLVNMMGGELHLSSKLGEGSTFWFEVDAEAVAPDPMVNAGQRGNVLLVESNDTLARSLSDSLVAMGYQVDCVRTGAEAISRVASAARQQLFYAVVLMDWRLPDLNGLQTAEFIANANIESRPRIVLMTASRDGHRFPLVSDDMSHVDTLLAKPATPLQLWHAMTVAGDSGLPVAETAPPEVAADALRGLRILVVEDNELNRQVAEELLSEEGASVDLADGGLEGVEKVLGGSDIYDLVIMDMQMPDIDGLEATRRIRAADGFADLPVLAMTANATASDRELCLLAGMNDHIGKPIDMSVVIPRILALVDREPVVRVQANPGGEQLAIRDEVDKRFGGNMKMFCRVQPKFAATVNQLLGDLEEGLLALNQKAVATALHSLKGTSGTMGAKALSEFSADLEQKIKSSQSYNWSLVLSSRTMEKLRDIAEASITAMQQLYSEFAVTSTDASPGSELDGEDLRRQLVDIIPLLEADNLRALELIESISAKLSNANKSRLEPLVSQVNSLDFASAIKTINRLAGEM